MKTHKRMLIIQQFLRKLQNFQIGLYRFFSSLYHRDPGEQLKLHVACIVWSVNRIYCLSYPWSWHTCSVCVCIKSIDHIFPKYLTKTFTMPPWTCRNIQRYDCAQSLTQIQSSRLLLKKKGSASQSVQKGWEKTGGKQIVPQLISW